MFYSVVIHYKNSITGQHLHGIRHHHSDGRFWFDLSEVPNLTTVISAELRLYINQTMVQENIAENEEDAQKDFLVTLYEIGKEDSLTYVDRMEVRGEQEGWISFNVSLVLKHWLKNPETNFGLQLVCRLDSSGRLTIHLPLYSLG